MNKNLYPWLVFFLGLSAASLLLQNVIRLLLGPRLFTLDSFGNWVLVMNITILIGSILILNYYRDQKYRIAFVTGTLYTACNFCYALLIYTILQFQKLAPYLIPSLFLTIGTGIAYSGSLIFLRSENKGWLKAAGYLMLVLGLVVLSSLIGNIIHTSFTIKSSIENISQWTALVGCLIPILFMIHFSVERRKPGTAGANTPVPMFFQNLVGIAGIASFSFTLLFGMKLSSESHSAVYWDNRNYEKTLELAQLFDPGVFVNHKGDTLRYRLLKPLDYDPSKKYPLVVSLPYGGQPGTDTIRQIEGAVAAELLVTDGNRSRLGRHSKLSRGRFIGF